MCSAKVEVSMAETHDTHRVTESGMAVKAGAGSNWYGNLQFNAYCLFA